MNNFEIADWIAKEAPIMEILIGMGIAVSLGLVKEGSDQIVKKRKNNKDWLYWTANGLSIALDYVTFKSDKRDK